LLAVAALTWLAARTPPVECGARTPESRALVGNASGAVIDRAVAAADRTAAVVAG